MSHPHHPQQTAHHAHHERASKKDLIVKISIVILVAIFVFAGTHALKGKVAWNSCGSSVTFPHQFPADLDFADYRAQEESDYWGKRIDNVGAKQARCEFERTYNVIKEFRIQHTAAHLFGALLYDKFGLKGLPLCSDKYNYGCYHAFFGKATSVGGADIFSEIDRSCAAAMPLQRVNCYHGAGHGILGFFGYDEKSLLRTLEECEKFSDKQGGCAGGAFMEYNARFLLHAPDIFASGNARPAEDDLHAPCSSLPPRFRVSCYSSQADWWSSIFQRDYRRVSELCAEAPGDAEQNACFRGMGKIIVWFYPKRIGEAERQCGKAGNDAHELLCRSAAAQTIFARTRDLTLAEQSCTGGLSKESKDICLAQITSMPSVRSSDPL